MLGLEELLNQSRAAHTIADHLVNPAARFLLKGPSGSGKSTIAAHAAYLLSRDFNTLWLTGGGRPTGTRFLALHRALSGVRSSRAVREAWRKEAASPLGAIPVLGSSAAGIARVAQAYIQPSGPDFLTAEQQDIIFGLRKAAGKQRLLLVVDNLHWLDSDSASLLVAASEPDTRRAFPFLDEMSMLMVETSDQTPSLEADLLSQLRPSDQLNLEPVGRDQFGQVLMALGLRAHLEADLVDELYAISRGHLEIAKEIVRLSQSSELEAAVEAKDAISLLSALLRLRLDGIEEAAPLEELLQIAVCVGNGFTKDELGCAFGDPVGFLNTLEVALREELIQAENGTLRFAHEAILSAMARFEDGRRAEFHGRLAECFRKLRPGDYRARLYHASRAGNQLEAQKLAFAAALQRLRSEDCIADVGGELELDCSSNLLAAIRQCYRLMEQGRHQEAIETLLVHYDGSDDLAQGELAILIALNYIKLKSLDSYNKAVAILERWRERRAEPELWQRTTSLMVSALAFAGEAERASQLHSILSLDLERMSPRDFLARSRLESLNRRAEMFCSPEIAAKHIERAVQWFGPSPNTSVPRYAFEYSASLVNLSGCLFGCGEFARAAATASAAIRCADELIGASLRLVEPYRPINNYAISALRAGLESAEDLCSTLDLVLIGEETSQRLDRVLVMSNRAVLALLAGRFDEGASLLRQTWKRCHDEALEDYYQLYVGTNLAVAHAIEGRRAEGKALLERLARCVQSMPRWLRQAHMSRHELVLEAVDDPSCITAADFDQYPASRRQPTGPLDSWLSIGRGFLLSDIQVWSEP